MDLSFLGWIYPETQGSPSKELSVLLGLEAGGGGPRGLEDHVVLHLLMEPCTQGAFS
jgi:hypothetical protein